MSNGGALGWVSDETGYRYQATHPETGEPWQAIPEITLDARRDLAECAVLPEACLVNLYKPETRIALHQDRDETELEAPVLSLSLGAVALFRYSGTRRSDPTRSIRLEPGDALVMGGASRLIDHGIDRVFARSMSELSVEEPAERDPPAAFLPSGRRCNLTLRRVNSIRSG